MLTASATFYTQLAMVNQRLECQLQLARVENGVPQQPIDVGAPVTVHRMIGSDRNQHQRLLSIAVTGAIAQQAGVFESQMACRAPDDDDTPSHRLEFIEGNMSVLSTRTNGMG